MRALLAAGQEVYVAAPRHEQSWVGAAKSRSRPVHSERADRGLGCPTWIVDGTPSDCVNIALGHLLPGAPRSPIEGVVSGINVGLNASLGFVLASGTLAGAWEGALHGLPCIAFSQEVTDEVYERLKAGGGEPEGDLRATLAASAAHAARLVPALLGACPPNSFIVHTSISRCPAPRRPPSAARCRPGSSCPGSLPRRPPTARTGSSSRSATTIPGGAADRPAALAGGWISHTVLDYTRLGQF